ncbi:MAG TPA: DUF5683 domain-containing protein [Fibrobacteraceae bacterium]|jgi:hypothetical protein|nr:hypothetical protein [Fibrobacter sp.]HPW94883.1 DUF5683 domain-containing protein [Fibrobacteraceae bacterium]
MDLILKWLVAVFLSLSMFIGLAFADDSPLVRGKTGIEALDTLATYEWDVPTKRNSLPLTLLSGILPGGAQIYSEHYIRGGFLVGIEIALVYEVFINKSFQQDRRFKLARPLQDSVAFYNNLIRNTSDIDTISSLHLKRLGFINNIKRISDKKMEEEDLRKAEFAWLVGLHLYGFVDGFGIWWNNQHRNMELKSSKKAVLLALIPGLGQMYNEEFGKAGLLYMGLTGAFASIHTSQKVVEYYLERRRIITAEAASSTEIEYLTERITYYRKNRNQYIWGAALIYLYSIGDAFVDAMMSDFDNPVHFAILPNFKGGLQAAFLLDF